MDALGSHGLAILWRAAALSLALFALGLSASLVTRAGRSRSTPARAAGATVVMLALVLDLLGNLGVLPPLAIGRRHWWVPTVLLFAGALALLAHVWRRRGRHG
jgi:hypothetical protein